MDTCGAQGGSRVVRQPSNTACTCSCAARSVQTHRYVSCIVVVRPGWFCTLATQCSPRLLVDAASMTRSGQSRGRPAMAIFTMDNLCKKDQVLFCAAVPRGLLAISSHRPNEPWGVLRFLAHNRRLLTLRSRQELISRLQHNGNASQSARLLIVADKRAQRC